MYYLCFFFMHYIMHSLIGLSFVPSRGIEPLSKVYETSILSVELQGRLILSNLQMFCKCIAKIHLFGDYAIIYVKKNV